MAKRKSTKGQTMIYKEDLKILMHLSMEGIHIQPNLSYASFQGKTEIGPHKIDGSLKQF
jgi:hypothetical protein